jgi:hypothetical protein
MNGDKPISYDEATPAVSELGEQVKLASTKWAAGHVKRGAEAPPLPGYEHYVPTYAKEIPDSTWSRKYGVKQNPTRHDLYVKEALKRFDFTVYDELRQYTRQPAGIRGMYKQLAKYDGPNIRLHKLPRKAKACMELALAQTREAFHLEEKPYRIQLEDMGEHLEPSSSAGYSFPGQKKGDCIPEILEAANQLHGKWKGYIPGGKYLGKSTDLPPCLAAQRGGMSTLGNWKTRLVWVYPAELIALEGRYAFPLYEEYRKRPCKPLLYGHDPDKMVLAWLQLKKTVKYLIGLDISSFDCTVITDLIKFAFDVIFENVDPCDPTILEDPNISERDKERHRSNEVRKHEIMKQALLDYFTHTPILMPDGRLFVTNRGVPSGTAFTQLVDSIVNHVYVCFAANMQDATIYHLAVLGDDSGFFSERFSVEQASADLGKYLGVELHPLKCDFTEDPARFKLLGFTYPGGRRQRPTMEWFALALCPENYVDNLCVSFSRLFGLWLAGAKDDEKFCRFMNYFQSGYPIPLAHDYAKDVKVLLTKVLNIPLISWVDLRRKLAFDPM